MRTLSEIITATRDGKKPEYEELRYAVCAMDALSTFDDMGLRKLVEAEQNGKPAKLVWSAFFQYEESFNRWKRALAMNPKKYIGWNNDPENSEFLKRRNSSKKIADSFINNDEKIK